MTSPGRAIMAVIGPDAIGHGMIQREQAAEGRMDDWFWRSAPAWLRRRREAAIDRYFQQHVVAAMAAAQANGIGIVHTWAAPGTPVADILDWFDDQLATVPRVVLHDCALNRFRFFIVRCTPAEWQAVQAGRRLSVPREQLLLTWEGQRADWWRAGHDAVAAVCADDHPGLYLVANRLGESFYAALHPGTY